MIRNCFDFRPKGLRHAGVKIFYSAFSLVLLLVLAIPASAADKRGVLQRTPPVYPEIAKRMRISGEVQLEVTVDATGKVTGTKPINGNHMLSEAASDAVKKWKFEPGDGVATVVVSINFAQ